MRIRYLEEPTETRARAARMASHVAALKSAGFDADVLRPRRSADQLLLATPNVAAIAAELDANDLLVIAGSDAAGFSDVAGEFSIVVDVSADPDARPHVLPPRCISMMSDGRATIADIATDPDAPTILVAPTILPPEVFVEPLRPFGSTPRVLVVGTDAFDGHAEMARYELHTRGVACNFVANGDREIDLAQKMRTHDILVLLSSSPELPTAFMNAMARGMFVITYDGGAEGRSIVDGVNGFKVEVGDWRKAARQAASARELDRAKVAAVRNAAQSTARTAWGEPARRALIEAAQRWLGRGTRAATKPTRRTRRPTNEASSTHA